jgi:2-polyprenyl-6-methoxyphenol hydroxylase-like FAD-dependent oxidoreductase
MERARPARAVCKPRFGVRGRAAILFMHPPSVGPLFAYPLRTAMSPLDLAPVSKTQILVVGAGPVGLFAALCAARRGLQVTILEQNFRSFARGHATLLHPSSMRLLGELGFSQRLLAEGRPIERIDLYIGGKHARGLELPMAALTITQSVLEEMLLNELRREEVEIRSPCEATTLSRSPDSVQARVVRRELVTGTGHVSDWEPIDSSLLEADFVIGADGYDSRVRESLGFENLAVGATETFAMFEGPRRTASATLDLSFQDGLGGLALPLPAQRGRWGFQLDGDLSMVPDLAHLRAFCSERAPWHDQTPTEVEWSTVTHFERRLARHFGSGRVWLAGDAAHITSPFGGQSMNGGLTEAFDLVERMAGCLLESKSLATLEQLGAAREREWHKLLGFNVQVDSSDNAPSWVREHARRIVPALPASGLDLQHLLRQLGITVR